MKKTFIIGLMPLFLLTGCAEPGGDSSDVSSSIEETARTFKFTRSNIKLETFASYKVAYIIEGFEEGAENRIEWKSDDASIASVDDLGYIYGVKEGVTTITASLDAYKASMEVSVYSSGEIPVFTCLEAVETYKDQILTFNEKVMFHGQKVDATYTYSSDNPGVVSVESGVVKSVAEGKANVKISAAYHGVTLERTCAVSVIPHVEIVLDRETISLAEASYEGTAYLKEMRLSATAFVNDLPHATSFSWKSIDPDIATVDNGLVKGMKEGDTTIECSFLFDGKEYTKSASVHVISPMSVIEEKAIVNMLENEKTLDLTGLGLDIHRLTSIKEVGETGEIAIGFFVKDGVIVLESIDQTYFNTTRRFKLKIAGETYVLTVEFKDYVQDKLYFADHEKHLSSLVPSAGVSLSYDSAKSLPESEMTNADRVSFAKELGGSTKVSLSGKNEDTLTLVQPAMDDVRDYNYIVYYVYTDASGYTASTNGGNETALVPGKWTRVVFDDFTKIQNAHGAILSENGYAMKDFVFRFTNYETPSNRAEMFVSSIYAGTTPKNKMVHLGKGLIKTFWWINGVYRTDAPGYEDFYAHESNGVGLDLADVEKSDVDTFKHEENTCMEISYDGKRPTIECFFFPGNCPLRGYKSLVFYVMTNDASAKDISVFMNVNKPKTIVPSLTQSHWTRVVMDLTDPDAVSQKGTSYLKEDNLEGLFFGFQVDGKAPAQAKFYVTSIYGF